MNAGTTTPRRHFLQGLATGGAVGMGALAGCSTDGGAATTTTSGDVEFVLSTAQSGQYGNVGENERRGFELAVKHLNEGGGLVEAGAFDAATGDGVLGKTVEAIVLDSEGSAQTAREKIVPYINDGSTAMITGGIAGNVVQEHRDLAVEHDVPYMVGASLLSDLAGEQCASQVYREQYTSKALMKGLGPALATEFGDSVAYYHLYSDSTEGLDLRTAFNEYFVQGSTANWQARGNEAIRPGSTDFREEIERVAASQPNVLVLSLFGLDVANALSTAKEQLSDSIDIVVPVIDDSLDSIVGKSVSEIMGTMPWDSNIDSEYTSPYNDAYITNYGPGGSGQAQTGSGTAHVVYTQTLHFAAAAERAGSFDPNVVQSELEGSEYDVGLGQQTLQTCNHQATRPVPVVRGQSNSPPDSNHFELVTLEGDVTADCSSELASSCSM